MSVKIEQLVAMRLNSYFKNQPVTPALTELKTELATDLNEAANDKNKSGLDPEAAVAEAFSDFGDINELIKQVNAENGTTKTIHGHHVVMDDDSLSVDDGETLMINSAGIYLKGGKAFKADADGVSINNGAIKADSHGLKLGSWTFDENGVNLNGDAQAKPAFDEHVDLAAEYTDNLPLVNEQQFSAAELKQLTVDYKSARVKVLPTTDAGDEIIIREYMNHNNTAYQAVIDQTDTTVKVVQGKLPLLIPVRVHVQILMPTKFLGNLAVTSHSGDLVMIGLAPLKVVNLKVQSGRVQLTDLNAQALSVEVNSGSCHLTRIQITEQLGMLVKSGRLRLAQVQAGRFTISAVSGTITGTELVGGGSWTVKSGAMRLDFAKVTGDTNLSAKSGSIKIKMPAEASYRYELEAHSGRIVAPRNGRVDHDADGYQAGQVGQTGQYLIQGHTVSGTLRFI